MRERLFWLMSQLFEQVLSSLLRLRPKGPHFQLISDALVQILRNNLRYPPFGRDFCCVKYG
jgi:hypothetical protein